MRLRQVRDQVVGATLAGGTLILLLSWKDAVDRRLRCRRTESQSTTAYAARRSRSKVISAQRCQLRAESGGRTAGDAGQEQTGSKN